MRKKNLIPAMLAATLLATSLTGCSFAAKEPATPSVVVSDAKDDIVPSRDSDETVQAQVEVNVTAEKIDESYYKDKPNTLFLGITDSEYAVHILTTFDQAISNLTLLELNSTFEPAYIGISIENEIQTIDEVTPGDEVVITGELGEFSPILGFSFVNGFGRTVYYSITESGEDGSIIIEEFEPTE